jgi:hypothetical protein
MEINAPFGNTPRTFMRPVLPMLLCYKRVTEQATAENIPSRLYPLMMLSMPAWRSTESIDIICEQNNDQRAYSDNKTGNRAKKETKIRKKLIRIHKNTFTIPACVFTIGIEGRKARKSGLHAVQTGAKCDPPIEWVFTLSFCAIYKLQSVRIRRTLIFTRRMKCGNWSNDVCSKCIFLKSCTPHQKRPGKKVPIYPENPDSK